ncbi:hypothetical protein OIU85_005717 [Salix viminalis]|uniref:Secreted protein n=1 Tax=Salix viminalis TaxID=40686 RepID=A0A9Q0STX4_SALVM|nr:hypothetical protein OIU85_005717 [Salix viminalis]
MTLQRHRHHFLSTLTFFTFLLFFSAPATALSHLGSGVFPQGGEERGKWVDGFSASSDPETTRWTWFFTTFM